MSLKDTSVLAVWNFKSLLFLTALLTHSLTLCCFSDNVATCQGKLFFPSLFPLLYVDVLDWWSLCLQVRSHEHSRQNRAQAQASSLNHKERHCHTQSCMRIHTRAMHVLADWLTASPWPRQCGDRQQLQFTASLPLSHLPHGLAAGQESKQNTELNLSIPPVSQLSLMPNYLLQADGVCQLSWNWMSKFPFPFALITHCLHCF